MSSGRFGASFGVGQVAELAWNPGKSPHCMAWFRADRGVLHTDGLVDSWVSQVDSAEPNKTITASGAARPTLARDAAYNNHFIIKTTGANQRLLSGGVWANTSPQANEVVVVGHGPANAAAYTLLDGYDTGTTRHFIRIEGIGLNRWQGGANGVLTATTGIATVPSIVSVTIDGAFLTAIYVTNPLRHRSIGNGGSAAITAGSCCIFANGNGGGAPIQNAPANTFIAEAIWFDKRLSNNERLTLFAYLGRRYRLPYG